MTREEAVEMLKAKLECTTMDMNEMECLRIAIDALNEVIKSENFVKELMTKAFSGTSYEEWCRKRKEKVNEGSDRHTKGIY